MPKIYPILIILQLLILSSFSHRDNRDVRLIKVAELASSSPEEAFNSLSRIDYNALDNVNRNYYDFLQIKTSDNAGIPHTSDSLFLSVIDYASTYKAKCRFYEEALYYGGRVYSELGDYATALHYSKQAVELIPEKNEYEILRGKVLRQNGKILAQLKLYSEAILNFESALELDHQLGDTRNQVLDLLSLGDFYIKQNDLAKAEECFTQAYILSQSLEEAYQSSAKMRLASVKYHKNEIDSARILLHGVPETVLQADKNNALSVASLIYHKSLRPDSAYYYASKLITCDDKASQKTGLDILLTPELRLYIPNDSLSSYIAQYKRLVDEMLAESDNELTQIQQARYSYSENQNEKKKSEDHKMIIAGAILGILFVVLSHKNKAVKLKLQSALDYVGQLEQNLSKWNTLVKKEHERIDSDIKVISISNETTQDLKEKLRNKLLVIYNSNNQEPIAINPLLLQSQAYQKLQELIVEQKELKDSSELWKELENSLYEVSPNFKDNLQLLVSGKLTSFDLKTAILIKYGVTPTQMASLFCRSKSAISSRRESLSQRIFDAKVPSKAIDAIIRLM